MRDEIEARIAQVYPTGCLSWVEDNLVYGEDYQHQVTAAIQTALQAHASVNLGPNDPFVSDAHYQYKLTHTDCPQWDTWEFSTKASDQSQWLQNHGKAYEVLWIYVSRIWTAYKFWFEFWDLDEDSQSIIHGNGIFPGHLSNAHESLQGSLGDIGLIELTHEELLEPVEGVILERYCIDEEDNDKIETESTNVEQCLLFPR